MSDWRAVDNVPQDLTPLPSAGDQSLFVRADEVEAAWKLYTPLLKKRPRVYPYPAGSWGPPEAAKFLHPDMCGLSHAPR